jgi:hypothetical protein
MRSPDQTVISKPGSNLPPIIHRSVTLKVDLRAVAAFGGALIILGGLLPWVSPLFAQIDRFVTTDSLIGGWPLIVIGLLAILAIFVPHFKIPRVSLPAAAFGFAAGLLALASAINTIGLQQFSIGSQSISSLSGLGLGVYLTLAGSIIAIIAGLAPQPIGSIEPARAEIKLWQSSSAILASMFILFTLGGIVLGWWLGNGALLGKGTPTPNAFNANVIGTPLINIQVNPLASFTPNPTEAQPTPAVPQVTPGAPIEPSIQPTMTPRIETAPAHTATPTETPTEVPTATATPTQVPSPLETPTVTSTATSTVTLTITPTVTPTP